MSNILVIGTESTTLAAIYIDPPTDMKSVPQSYTLHCITTGQNTSSITVGLFLETHSQMYYTPPRLVPVSGYSQVLPTVSTLNSVTFTYDYSEEVVWSADKVVEDATEFRAQGVSKYNGDHDWACRVDYPDGEYDDLQTYIRGKH